MLELKVILKYLEFESMSREEKHIWLKNGIDPETGEWIENLLKLVTLNYLGETAVNSEDEKEDEFYSLSTLASKHN